MMKQTERMVSRLESMGFTPEQARAITTAALSETGERG